jgi:ubiquinol-cytochrome c reductase iron-sulfur subunit
VPDHREAGARVRRLGRWLLGLFILLTGLLRGRPPRPRIVPEGDPDRLAELAVVLLLVLAALCGAGFVVVYAVDSLGNRTQLFGILLGGAFAFLAAALIVVGKRLIVTEELEEPYPRPEHPTEQLELTQIVRESGSRFTRKRLMIGAATGAAGAVGLAALIPALSLGPALATDPLLRTPWRRGRRLVDENGRRYSADDIETGTFYTAFAEGAPKDDIGSPLVVVRLDPRELRLPADRSGWAPEGILAYSKICTHAGCAIALYRKPTFAPVQPRPALVCPCHYSTFDPAAGGTVLFGPAGRNLPQLPLTIDRGGGLRAAGNFSGPVGPSWWGVRMWQAQT